MEDFGRYKVLREIGEGGMAKVYLAYDSQLQCNVALKVLAKHPDPQISERLKDLFVKEAQVLAQLNHPNVVRIFDLNRQDGNPYISMEYVEGLSLAQFLRKKSRLSLSERIKIFTEICKGVAAIHSKGVVHRDLKPDNVLISNSGEVKVTDFGIVEDFRSEDNFVAGTPAFMAPEQLKSGRADMQSDIFSLGIIGAILFSGKNPVHSKEAVRFPASTPIPLKKLIESCLQREPKNRPSNVSSIIQVLEGTALESPQKSLLKISTAAKFLIFCVLVFAASRLYVASKSVEHDRRDYYSAIDKCYPNCERSPQSLTKTLDWFFPAMKCGDGICSYLENACALCPEDCKSVAVPNWKARPACLTFTTPAPADPSAREARLYFDECGFGRNLTSVASPQDFAEALVSCVRRSKNPVITDCAKKFLADQKDFGSEATKFTVCVLKGSRNF